MIIFGYRGRHRKIASGLFNCPHCGARRTYNHIRIQRWFTLYFIPVFPLQTLGEAIMCEACNQGYSTDVLAFDPEKQRMAQIDVLSRMWCSAMIAVACAFGKPNHDQVMAVHASLEKASVPPSSIDDIAADCRMGPANGVAADEIIARLEGLPKYLSAQNVEVFLEAARAVVEAGSGESQQKQELLRRIGTALGMSDAHIRGVLA